MEFFDKPYCDQIIVLNKIDDKIDSFKSNIQNFKSRISTNNNNIQMQTNAYDRIVLNKVKLLKKYNISIIKNAYIYYMKNKEIDCINLMIDNNNDYIDENNYNLINKIKSQYSLNKNIYFVKLIKYINSNKEDLQKIIDIFNSNDLNSEIFNSILVILKKNKFIIKDEIFDTAIFQLLNYNTINNIRNILDGIINKFISNLLMFELNLFFKHSNKISLKINKYLISNDKCLVNIVKKYKIKQSIVKKSNNLLNKYKAVEKQLLTKKKQFDNNICNILNNINDLHIHIEMSIDAHNIYIIKKKQLRESILKQEETSKYLLNRDSSCPICLEDIVYGITTKCKHDYHLKCINMYINNILENHTVIKILCPICRQYI